MSCLNRNWFPRIKIQDNLKIQQINFLQNCWLQPIFAPIFETYPIVFWLYFSNADGHAIIINRGFTIIIVIIILKTKLLFYIILPLKLKLNLLTFM